ncbi:glycoside hydrolase family 6 protein [Xylaria bambusicola]|uniref:glycoside hydrolase family 6 protein n=1 Tax=Xylaria bambusicola TaxID=326684 RepID=UPI00200762DE|nr:glycoside hydrolase family 6 protein [Xylaria bambusicola]KAI0505842.1 glycoside hydrolase family 6 protein [Xylaria bambusicola]
MFCSSVSNLVIAIAFCSLNTLAAQCTAPALLNAQENIWKSRALHPTSLYQQKIQEAITAIKDEELKIQASRVADFGTFTWIKSLEDIRAISSIADEVPCDEILGLVLDHLPYKNAAPDGSSPPYDAYTEDEYKSFYIEPLATVIKAHPTTAFAVVVEPGAFPQYFNASTGSTISVHSMNLLRSYRANIPVALQGLNLPNAIFYLDAGHSNSLDWSYLRNHTADLFAEMYNISGRPAQMRGFATNVGNWNGWDLSPGEFAHTEDSRDIRPSNEKNFIHILSSTLQARGLSMHAILDTSRNGVIGLRYSWDEWCNVDGAGLGVRPSAETGDDAVDAFVWVKRPGESDGVSSERGGDEVGCAARSAFRPAPERDDWFQWFFEMLVRNAKPNL